jgi:hypothetical protein
MTNKERLLARAAHATRGSRAVALAREISSPRAQLELIRDIVALANAGGGVIVWAPDAALDVAALVRSIETYTDQPAPAMRRAELAHEAVTRTALIVEPSDVPIVFAKAGAHGENGAAQILFAAGTIYFRHGAKSEPARRADLVRWRDRALHDAQRDRLAGSRKVVHAPAGHSVMVLPPSGVASAGGVSVEARISGRASAPSFVPRNAEEIWPHRQQGLLNAVNRHLPRSAWINGYDVMCVNRKYDVLKSRPDFAYKPHHLASPQYSSAYATWLVEHYQAYPAFFREARAAYQASKK